MRTRSESSVARNVLYFMFLPISGPCSECDVRAAAASDGNDDEVMKGETSASTTVLPPPLVTAQDPQRQQVKDAAQRPADWRPPSTRTSPFPTVNCVHMPV